MSWAALEWARQQKCGKSGRKFCLIMLANYADESGTCYPRVEVIAGDMEAGVSTVHTYLADLEKAGLLRVLVRYAKRGGRRSNRYQLLLQGEQTPMPDSDDWHYERPDTEARRARGRRKSPESGDFADQGDHPSESQSHDTHASKSQTDEPPGSGDMNLQDLDVSIKKEVNHQQEPPVGTASSVPAPQERRPADSRMAAQTTIDGAEEPLNDDEEPDPKDVAKGIARVWIDYWANPKRNAPIGGAAPHVLHARMTSCVLGFLTRGYSKDEIGKALNLIGKPTIPTPDRLQQALGEVRGVRPPAQNARRAARRAGANVEEEWSDVRPAGGGKAFAATSTGGADQW